MCFNLYIYIKTVKRDKDEKGGNLNCAASLLGETFRQKFRKMLKEKLV